MSKSKKRVLLAPLNWGLGHVTRSAPLIRALERNGVEVVLASDGDALHLLRAEFPHLAVEALPSYKIRYAGANMVRNIAVQLPRILYAVRAEYSATAQLVRKYQLDGIISDNRYGCFCAGVPSVLLTHQLYLKVPAPSLEWMANRVLRLALRKFDQIWVPDIAEKNGSLSGELSHGEKPVHRAVSYIGPLSRMQPAREEDFSYDVAIVLSGPEPQRTVLEQKLLEQALEMPYNCILVQGKTAEKQHYFAADHVEVVSFLTAGDLQEVLNASRYVVCRSGYSSLMDLAVLGKKALLIPTPGQTEQEYLARYFANENIFPCQQQDRIQLEAGLELLESYNGLVPEHFSTNAFEPLLQNWVAQL